MSGACTNEDCDTYGYELEYDAPDNDEQARLAEQGAEWLEMVEATYIACRKPWLYKWIERCPELTLSPASQTLKTLLSIYALVRKYPCRLPVAETREWVDQRGWKPTKFNEPTVLYDSNPVPILLRVDLAGMAKQAGLSITSVRRYLQMMARLRLLRVAAREEHGQIVYQAGWWRHGAHHPQPDWFIKKGKQWTGRLRRISSGQMRLQ